MDMEEISADQMVEIYQLFKSLAAKYEKSQPTGEVSVVNTTINITISLTQQEAHLSNFWYEYLSKTQKIIGQEASFEVITKIIFLYGLQKLQEKVLT